MARKQTIKTKVTKKSTSAPKQVTTGRFYVTATFNNTLVTFTDLHGNTLAWSSSGAAGFKGARRATPYAAILAVELVTKKLKELGVTSAEVYIKGPGPGRDASIRALRNTGININMIADITATPYNGVRAKKKRRV